MGYTTDFLGSFKLDKPLTPDHLAYLKKFSETRRMKRNAAITETLPDPIRLAAGLPVGKDGGYFVGAPDGEGFASFGQTRTDDVIGNGNDAPTDQPGLWCQWVPNDAGTEIQWDEGEKFYDYVEWLEYLIEHFLKPWGYRVITGRHAANGNLMIRMDGEKSSRQEQRWGRADYLRLNESEQAEYTAMRQEEDAIKAKIDAFEGTHQIDTAIEGKDEE